MRKKIMSVCLAVFALGMLCSAALPTVSLAADSNLAVYLDGNILELRAQIDGQNVYLPVRPVCEALGYNVLWLDQGGIKTIIVSKEGDNVTLDLTKQEVTDNGHNFTTSAFSWAGIKIISSRTFIESALFSTIFAMDFSCDTTNNLVTLQRRNENNLTITTEKITSVKDHLKTTIQYPQLSDLHDANVQNEINAILKESAQNALGEGKKNADDMVQAIKDGYTGAVGMCETYYNYMIKYNQNGLLSIVLTDYQYAGGAHGGTVQRAYTFDLTTGKALQLSDLMDATCNAVKYIDSEIRKEINKRVAAGELYEFDFSKFKDIGENPEYYMSNDALVFYFQQYAYFPYAAGIQEFEVTFLELNSMLNKEFRFLSGTPVVLNKKEVNTLSVGDIGQVLLDGNASTGYSWHYTLSSDDIISLISEYYTSSAIPGIVGAGGTYTWNIKALKAGDTTITFKYYSEWEGEQTALHTVVFDIMVR